MARSRRAALALTVAVVVVAGLISLVVVVASPASSRVTEADVAVHGQPPTTAVASFTVSTGDIDVTGQLRVNFASGELAGSLVIPGLVSSSTVQFVLAPGTLYVSYPNLDSVIHAQWITVPTSIDERHLASVAQFLETVRTRLTPPPPFLGSEVVTHTGTFTTYRFHNPSADVVEPPGVPLPLPHVANLVTSVTVGAEGQFAAGSVFASAPNFNYGLSITVQDYDRLVRVTLPSASTTTSLTTALRRKLLGSVTGALNELLSPRGLASLLTIRVR